MKFKNFEREKEYIDYFSGDVLSVYSETLCEEEVYMVISRNAMFNILDLNCGVAYFSDYEVYDDFVRKLERLFTSIEVIDNDELELVRVEV